MSELLLFIALAAAAAALLRAQCDHRAYGPKIRRLERELRDAERLLRLRGTLAREVAHEIKNPITAILCSAETLDLLIGDEVGDDHRQSLRYIREYGENLLRLVSDFLDVSRAEQAHLHARPEAVRLLPAIEAICGLLKGSAVKKHVNIELLSLEANPLVWIDPAHLKQIVFNLLHNAIKFAPQKGRIQVIVKSAFPENFLSIAVQDNGSGISPELLPHIFDLYSTGQGTGCQPEVGTGLGLALCKALVTLAGGEINARSEAGRGTSLEFTVPQYQPQSSQGDASSELQPQQTQTANLRGQRYLVADKDQGARESIAGLLTAWGAMVDQVERASEAVKAICQNDYSAVIADGCSDGVSARELAQAVRAHTGKAGVRIVIASREETAAAQSDCDAFIEKPLNGKALLESLRPGRH